jgi:hypothetical protein
VEGADNAHWLREQILHQGAGCGDVKQVAGTLFNVFLAYHTRHVDELTLRGIVSGLAEVRLMLEPA